MKAMNSSYAPRCPLPTYFINISLNFLWESSVDYVSALEFPKRVSDIDSFEACELRLPADKQIRQAQHVRAFELGQCCEHIVLSLTPLSVFLAEVILTNINASSPSVD